MKQTLPTIHQIIKSKESNIKIIIDNIIEANAGKSSRYTSMAEDLLKKHEPADVVSAILKYSFKHELELNAYKAIVEGVESPSRPRKRPGRDRFKKRAHSKRPHKKHKGRRNR